MRITLMLQQEKNFTIMQRLMQTTLLSPQVLLSILTATGEMEILLQTS